MIHEARSQRAQASPSGGGGGGGCAAITLAALGIVLGSFGLIVFAFVVL